jgi:iron complex outermembrane receptor protein
VFSAVGYDTKEMNVTDASTYKVSLTQNVKALSDVVVVGYGRASRKVLTTSVSSVKGEDLNKGAISDIGQLLQGKVPGLNISRSGDPNRAASVILRGSSTLRNGAQTPFYVIDGVPGADISLIAPEDIASIDVLKDAAAAAIYGNRGANGVIIVTLKKGKSGQTQLNYSTYAGVEKVSNQYEMMSADQLRAYLAANNQSLTPANDKGVSTNWQDEVQRSNALSYNHNLALSGGSEKTTYNATLNYFKQDGIIKKSSLDRLIGRISVDQKAFNDKLKLGISLANSISNSNLTPYRNTVLTQMLTYLPTSPVKNPDGTYFDNLTQNNYYNPVSLIDNGTENLKYKTFLGTFTANLKLPFGFTYDLIASYQNFRTDYGSYYNGIYTSRYANVRSTPDPPNPPTTLSLLGQNGLALRNTYQNTNKIVETFLTWDRKFGDHSINAVFGYSYQSTVNGDGFQTSSTNFPIDNASYFNLGLGSPNFANFRPNYGGVTYDDILLISDFARVNYNYKNKYVLQGSIRRDGSNVFGENNKWGYFPSISGTWRIDQESFMKNQTLFSDLKLRASYGIAGNSSGIIPTTAITTFGRFGDYNEAGLYQASLYTLQTPNPNLKWERTSTLNFGLDFSILKGKVSGSLDVYDKRTTDLITTIDVDQSLYYTPFFTGNVGEMSNKGIEFILNATPVSKSAFTWNTSLNMAHNTNKIESLNFNGMPLSDRYSVQPDGGGQTGSTVQVIKPGEALGTFFTFKYAGKNAAGVSQYVDVAGNLTTAPLNRRDYYTAGNAQPKLLLGWNNNFSYHNFDLNVFMRAVLGNKIMNVTRADLFRPSTAQFNNIPVEAASESIADFNSYRYSSRFIESGSYLRMDNATLGYTFKKGIPGVRSLRIYTTANNLFLITGYKGIDPEIEQGGLAPGVDSNNFYPKTRTFLIGLNVSFN